eukprot:jgi/Botrbrau1/12627/Bobra.0169s0152.1
MGLSAIVPHDDYMGLSAMPDGKIDGSQGTLSRRWAVWAFIGMPSPTLRYTAPCSHQQYHDTTCRSCASSQSGRPAVTTGIWLAISCLIVSPSTPGKQTHTFFLGLCAQDHCPLRSPTRLPPQETSLAFVGV